MISSCIQMARNGLVFFAHKVSSYDEDKMMTRFTDVHTGQQMVTFMRTARHRSIGEDIYLALQGTGCSLPRPMAQTLSVAYRAFRISITALLPKAGPKFEAFATRAMNKGIAPHGLLLQQLFSLAIVASSSYAAYSVYSRAYQQLTMSDSLLGGLSVLLLIREVWASFLSTRFVPAPPRLMQDMHLQPFQPGDQVPQLL